MTIKQASEILSVGIGIIVTGFSFLSGVLNSAFCVEDARIYL